MPGRCASWRGWGWWRASSSGSSSIWIRRLKQLGKAWQGLAEATGAPTPQLDMGAFAEDALELGATLATTGLEAAGLGLGLKAAKIVAGAVKTWTLPLGRSEKALPDQDRQVQELLGAVNLLVGEVQSSHRTVLFVIDGLDRIREVDRAKALFVESQLLSQIACPVVVCGPFALRHHLATAGVRGFKTPALVNEPVLDHAQPDRQGAGVQFFREMYAQRVKDLGEPAQALISRELLGELAYRSGGRARDFVRFIRSLAEVGWDRDTPVATPEIVRQVLDEWRLKQETGLHKGHIRLLEEVAKDPEHRLPEDPLAYELLDYQHLLPYPNESEWYYPHPLLTMHLVRTSPIGSGG